MTYIWSEFVCSIAFTNWVTNASSLIANKLFASSATRGWNNNDLFNDVSDGKLSDIGNSLSTVNEGIKKCNINIKMVINFS